MKRGQIYKHENCTDAAIEVLNIPYAGDTKIKVRVSWWNVVSVNPFPMGIVETIELQRADLPKWTEWTPAEVRR